MHSYRLVKKQKGFIAIQILLIFFLILFLTSILFKLSAYRLQKADLEKDAIENSLRQADDK